MAIRLLFLFGILFGSVRCTTMAGLDNPIINPPKIDTNNKKTILIEFVTNDMSEESRATINEILKESDVFKKVYINIPLAIEKPSPNNSIYDYFPAPSVIEKTDLKVKIALEMGRDLFHPYCLLFLTILPCTPPFNVLVSAQVRSSDGKLLGTYYVNEDATEVTWAFGFLLPAARPLVVKRKEVLANLFNHIFTQMAKDKII